MPGAWLPEQQNRCVDEGLFGFRDAAAKDSSTQPLNQIKKGTLADALFRLAERVGFEPTVA